MVSVDNVLLINHLVLPFLIDESISLTTRSPKVLLDLPRISTSLRGLCGLHSLKETVGTWFIYLDMCLCLFLLIHVFVFVLTRL